MTKRFKDVFIPQPSYHNCDALPQTWLNLVDEFEYKPSPRKIMHWTNCSKFDEETEFLANIGSTDKVLTEL